MEKVTILLKRVALQETYTIGHVFLNDETNKICDSLEDRVRSFTAEDPKIWGETAIPYGAYVVTKEQHIKFGRCFRVHNVPHFAGIFIHCGNYAKHTHGCPLLGYNTVKGAVMDSRKAMDKLFNLIPNNAEITLKIYK